MDFELPNDLTALEPEQLTELHDEATGYFQELAAAEADADVVQAMAELSTMIKSLRTERKRRQSLVAEQAEEQRRIAAELEEEDDDDGDDAEEDSAEEDNSAGDEADAESNTEAETVETPEPVLAAAVDQLPKTRKLNIPKIRQRQPVMEMPNEQERLTITASADIPGIRAGAPLNDLGDLVTAINKRARNLPISHGNPNYIPIATVHNSYDHVVEGEKTSASEMEQVYREISNVDDVLVAAGGWCAPSEIQYEFFDMLCDDGEVDAPTFGVNRGGIRYPQSPTLADVWTGTFDNTTNPWLWTEDDDISAATGSLVKPCVRVPCPDFDERRLECYGICLTAGNLIDDAYPEAVRNQIRLLRSAHFHAMNARFIATMVSMSGTTITGGAGSFGAAQSTSSDLPGYMEWAATDIRNRYGMCDTDVLEVVLPAWVRAVIRADLARKNGLDLFAVTNERINDFFDVRSIRVQWVKDWQVRGTDQPGGATPTVVFPDTVDFMMYPAGTFAFGRGMTLDLGIVRDSALNEKNDHTALWTEECHLVAKFGPVSRLYRHTICAAGRSGAQPDMTCLT